MPSSVVHVAVAGLLGTALLADAFDARAILVVMAAAVVPDLDTFVGLVIPNAHRAAFHTFLLPAALALLLAYDLHVRESSWVESRWGRRGRRIAWVSLVTFTFAGSTLDLFTNGVNVLYPLHDQFYTFSGHVLVSSQRGFVQTIFQFPHTVVHTTANTHYSTPVNPTPGPTPKHVERIYPIADTGVQFVLAVVGYSVVGFRLWEHRTHKG